MDFLLNVLTSAEVENCLHKLRSVACVGVYETYSFCVDFRLCQCRPPWEPYACEVFTPVTLRPQNPSNKGARHFISDMGHSPDLMALLYHTQHPKLQGSPGNYTAGFQMHLALEQQRLSQLPPGLMWERLQEAFIPSCEQQALPLIKVIVCILLVAPDHCLLRFFSHRKYYSEHVTAHVKVYKCLSLVVITEETEPPCF